LNDGDDAAFQPGAASVLQGLIMLCDAPVCLAGTLEWQEKQKPNDAGPRMTRSLPCHIVTGPDDPDM